jgi:excisionase family DNA binding protein
MPATTTTSAASGTNRCAGGGVMTTQEVAALLGFADSTVVKLAAELGGYRSSKRGPWRFVRERVESWRGRETELRRPSATMQALAKDLTELTALSIERDNRITTALAKLTERLDRLEGRAAFKVLPKAA